MGEAVTTAALLVPYRADGGQRDRLWRFCRRRWQQIAPDVQLIEGEDAGEGLWCRSEALNDAAAQTAAEVLIVCDADVFTTREQLDLLIHVAATTRRFTVGFHRTVKLDPTGTDMVLDGWRDGWERHVETMPEGDADAFVAVHRDLWDEVDGFDERFVGRGWQGVAFRVACETLAGPRVTLWGDLWHLWHPYGPADGDRGDVNRELLDRHYIPHQHDPDGMRRMLAERDAE